MRQGAQQHVRGAAPRRLPPLEPIPLHLLAGRVTDLDRLPAGHPGARLAVRPQARQPQLPGETDVRLAIGQRYHLVVQRRRPQVRVVGEPGRQLLRERRSVATQTARLCGRHLEMAVWEPPCLEAGPRANLAPRGHSCPAHDP